jgi:hypothetical protein
MFADAPKTIKDVGERYGKLFTETEKQWRELAKEKNVKPDSPAPTSLPDPEREKLRQILYADGMPFGFSKDEVPRLFTIYSSSFRDGTAGVVGCSGTDVGTESRCNEQSPATGKILNQKVVSFASHGAGWLRQHCASG